MSRLASVVALLLLPACGGDGGDRASLTVYAASSLTEAFTDIAALFEETHPGVDVSLTFAGSQILRLQIDQGAPADVFASADPVHLRALADAGMLRDERVFAHNELVVVVPADNPAGIESFEDLPRAGRIVLGTPDVPVGRYARRALTRADSVLWPGFAASVLERVVSQESNVRLARAKVELGEADAAVVYLTDAVGADRVRMIPVPDEVNVRAEYVVGVVERDGRSALADAWVEALLSASGRAALERHGFLRE